MRNCAEITIAILRNITRKGNTILKPKKQTRSHDLFDAKHHDGLGKSQTSRNTPYYPKLALQRPKEVMTTRKKGAGVVGH